MSIMASNILSTDLDRFHVELLASLPQVSVTLHYQPLKS